MPPRATRCCSRCIRLAASISSFQTKETQSGARRKHTDTACRRVPARYPGEADWRGGLARRTGEAPGRHALMSQFPDMLRRSCPSERYFYTRFGIVRQPISARLSLTI